MKYALRNLICSLVMTLTITWSIAQKTSDIAVEPPFWWTEMVNKDVQLLIKGDNIGVAEISLNGSDVVLKKVHKADNPNFAFIDLTISENAKPQTLNILLDFPGRNPLNINYKLKKRQTRQSTSVNMSDVIYLITPDRFANGDDKNDHIKEMYEKPDRSLIGGRHGGDIAGISSKLDYFQKLGVTALWINPLVENNMPSYSYHGYAITDFYKIDPRYGSSQDYLLLSKKLHGRGMKLIMDMVFNHSGSEHWWIKEMPYNDWVHDFGTHQITNHNIASISDPYAALQDQTGMEKGWFVPTMPDLNHDNDFMVNYLIQNSIWWIEFAQLDGIRMDTYPYNLASAMIEWTRRVLEEYPGFYLLGETWVNEESLEAYWAPRHNSYDGFNSGLTSTTDFPLQSAMANAFKDGGDVRNLYDVLSKDFLYDKPMTNTIFLDNHDMDRVFHTLDRKVDRLNLAITFLMTTRGIPQIYYGTEILLAGNGDHGKIRQDFPGGWKNDEQNAFDITQFSAEQKRAFDHISKMTRLRSAHTALQSGKLIHYRPQDNMYVYARHDQDSKFIIVLNNNPTEVQLSWSNYEEIIGTSKAGTNLLNDGAVSFNETMSIAPLSSLVIKLDH
ncbi:MAG: glycoside hydrolase family 13 protein [Reichenbachiella sp.]|uniref:glycoside hydrolase family 13 protein n=1 Tax=Reichenbachiella sp. TaxID=2184521 RepID=UPI003296C92D